MRLIIFFNGPTHAISQCENYFLPIFFLIYSLNFLKKKIQIWTKLSTLTLTARILQKKSYWCQFENKLQNWTCDGIKNIKKNYVLVLIWKKNPIDIILAVFVIFSYFLTFLLKFITFIQKEKLSNIFYTILIDKIDTFFNLLVTYKFHTKL